MIPAILISILMTLAAIAAMVFILYPEQWIRLWNPWKGLAGSQEMWARKNIARTGVRLRATFCCIALLCGAAIVPVSTALRLYGPGKPRRDHRAVHVPSIVPSEPSSSFVPVSELLSADSLVWTSDDRIDRWGFREIDPRASLTYLSSEWE